MAQWLAANGITGAVLKYRMPNHHPRSAAGRCRTGPAHHARRRAGRRRLPPARKVGIAGFSAGGHLAAMASTIGSVRTSRSSLPGHPGTWGQAPSGVVHQPAERGAHPEQDAAYSLESRVTEATPPGAAAASGRRRQDGAAGQQYLLLHGPEGARHRSLDAHLSHGRPRLGHPRIVPLQGSLAGRRAGLAPQTLNHNRNETENDARGRSRDPHGVRRNGAEARGDAENLGTTRPRPTATASSPSPERTTRPARPARPKPNSISTRPTRPAPRDSVVGSFPRQLPGAGHRSRGARRGLPW